MHWIGSSFSGNCCAKNDLRVKPFRSMSRVKPILLLIIMIISCEVRSLLTFRVLVVHACLIWAKELPLVAEFSYWLISKTIAISGNSIATSGNSSYSGYSFGLRIGKIRFRRVLQNAKQNLESPQSGFLGAKPQIGVWGRSPNRDFWGPSPHTGFGGGAPTRGLVSEELSHGVWGRSPTRGLVSEPQHGVWGHALQS